MSSKSNEKADAPGGKRTQMPASRDFAKWVDFIPDALITTDLQRNVTAWNAAAEELYGWSTEEVIGKPLDSFVQTIFQEGDSVSAAAQAVLEMGTWSGEVTQQRRDGTRLPIWSSVSVLRDDQDKAIGLIGINRDLTERRRAEQALIESQSIFRGFLEQSQDAIMLTDEQGAVSEWSKGAEILTGYSRAETLGKPLWDVQFRSAPEGGRSAELYENIRVALQAALGTGQAPFFNRLTETMIQRPDGSLVTTQTLAFSIPTTKGCLLASILRDISERKAAEEHLRASQARYKGLFEDAPISLWEEDFSGVKRRLDGLQSSGVTDLRAYLASHPEVVEECASLIRVVDVNKATMHLFGAKRKEQLLLSVAEIVEAPSSSEFVEQLIHIAEGKTSLHWEGINKTLDGGLINAGVNWSVVPGCEDTFSRVTLSMIDITERKLAETRIKALARFPDENLMPVLRLSGDGLILYANAASGALLGQWGLGIGQRAPAFWIRTVAQVLKTQSKQVVEEWVGTRLWSFDVVPIAEAGYVNLYGHDITDRRQAEESMHRQLSRLSALHQIDQFISNTLDLHMTLTEIVKQVKNQLGVDAADVLLLNNASLDLEYTAGLGFRTKAAQQVRVRLGQPHAGLAALNRQMVEIPDLRGEPQDSRGKAHLEAEDFVSYYGVPLIAKGNIKGVLELYHRTLLTPDREWREFLEIIAGQAGIAIDNALMFGNLERSNLDLTLAYDATIKGWSHAMDLRDKETEGHTLRVTDMSMDLAASFGINQRELINNRRGALLHDVGKMGVPDAILLKPGPLTPDEWVIMKRHPTLAYEMLSPIPYLSSAIDIPYCHHEKWDGSGYPRGLQGLQIPLSARIFAIVDVWDALISDRPYRPAWTKEKALEYIESQAGKHFDPQVVETFVQSRVFDRDGDKWANT
jgi:PAS domain S-box-containing protein